MGFCLFGKKNLNIGKDLKDQAFKVSGKPQDQWTDQDVCDYFLKVGFDCKGDMQSYMYGKGSSKSVDVTVDLVALAVACAGAPLPSVGVVADVGVKTTFKSTKNNLIAAYVPPKKLITNESGSLITSKSGLVVFLGMTGFKWEKGIELHAEVGVKTPEVPGLPSTTGGGWGTDNAQPKQVEGGTYAELCSFELGAKATATGSVGISGERIYMSDTVPTYIDRESGDVTNQIKFLLMEMLRLGNKKAIIKTDVKTFLEQHNHGLKRNFFKRHISGGEISTSNLIKELEAIKLEIQNRKSTVTLTLQEVVYYIKSLKDYKAQDVLAPHTFISLWGMKPEASAGVGAKASASIGASVGVASAGVGASATITGPSVAGSLKFTHYRFQVAALAKPEIPKPGSQNPKYIIMTQDTKITYGQLDLTLLGVSGEAHIGAEQGLTPSTDRFQKEKKAEKVHKGKAGVVQGSASAKFGIEEISAKASGSAALKKALNFMKYKSAVAYWSPPDEPVNLGKTKTSFFPKFKSSVKNEDEDEKPIQLANGSGFAFGQSVDLVNFYNEARVKKSRGYLKRLAKSLKVTPDQLNTFIDGAGDLIDSLAIFASTKDKQVKMQYADHIPEISAFLIESTFTPQSLPQVNAKWKKGRWILGPHGVKTLRNRLIPETIDTTKLQAIRLRYRIADSVSSERKRFALGFKYIVSLGIEYKSVEEAGSEGIVNLWTVWFNDFNRYNTIDNQMVAYEDAVPQVALLHQ